MFHSRAIHAARLLPALVAVALGVGVAPRLCAQEFGVIIPLIDPSMYGTSGSDNLSPGPSKHTVHDGPESSGTGTQHQSDGKRDNIDTRNGKNESIYCGPEDAIQADPDDTICLQSRTAKLIWKGTFREYLQMLKLMHRVRFLLAGQLPGAGLALQAIRADHVAISEKLSEMEASTVYQFLACAEFEPLEDLTVFESEVPELALWFPAQDFEPGVDTGILRAEEVIRVLEGVVTVIDELDIQQP